MKKLRLLFFAIPFILFSSCDKTEDPVGESVKSYKYTYKINEKLTPKNINLTVVSGDIKLVNGQGTDTSLLVLEKILLLEKFQELETLDKA
jgi:hypothetical protein